MLAQFTQTTDEINDLLTSVWAVFKDKDRLKPYLQQSFSEENLAARNKILAEINEEIGVGIIADSTPSHIKASLKGLTRIPQNLLNFISTNAQTLKQISFRGNNLRSVPLSILELPNLECLVLAENRLSAGSIDQIKGQMDPDILKIIPQITGSSPSYMSQFNDLKEDVMPKARCIIL